MKFEDALKLMREGKKVKIKDWDEKNHYIKLGMNFKGYSKFIEYHAGEKEEYFLDDEEIIDEEWEEYKKWKSINSHIALEIILGS